MQRSKWTWTSFYRIRPKALDTDGILDILEEEEVTMEAMYVEPEDPDDSDGYDDENYNEGQPEKLSRTMLKVEIKNPNLSGLRYRTII